jgi:signal transduction histidine kinase
VTDPGRIAQVLTNLVGNAVKFSPREGRVDVRVRDHDGRSRVEVRDEGPGIPPQDAERIFDRFVKASDASTQHKPGAGLGLTISKAIVDALGGHIGVMSPPGQGATFYFELPTPARFAEDEPLTGEIAPPARSAP